LQNKACYLSHSHLIELPESFKINLPQFSSLLILHLDNNSIKELPNKIFDSLFSLTELNLSGNLLSTLPADFSALTSLTLLRVAYNQFTSFPKQVCSILSLQSINFESNEIPEIPEEIGNLKEIKKFIMSNNKN